MRLQYISAAGCTAGRELLSECVFAAAVELQLSAATTALWPIQEALCPATAAGGAIMALISGEARQTLTQHAISSWRSPRLRPRYPHLPLGAKMAATSLPLSLKLPAGWDRCLLH